MSRMAARATPPTLVTALVDVGRGRLAGPFARSFVRDDLVQLERLFDATNLPMVVYLDPRHADVLWRARRPTDTRLVPLRPEDVDSLPHYRRVQEIRADPAWLAQAPWLGLSPQARLPRYNPSALSKPRWLAEQARANPFGSDHLFWIDPGLVGRIGEEPLRDSDLGARLARAAGDRVLIGRVPRRHDSDLHGFDAAALERLAGGPVEHVARSGLFGGRFDAIAALAERYEALLGETLAAGHMGTEESLLTILVRRWPELFAAQHLEAGGLFDPSVGAAVRRRDTFVTAIYNLDPAAPLGGRGRPVAFYRPSRASIAQMGAGLVVYTDPANVDRIEGHLTHLGAPAVVIGRELASAPRADQIQEIRVRQRFETKPWRDRCHVLCHAKPAWLAEQAEANPFDSSRFYWIDAGLAYPGLMPRRYLGDYASDRCSLMVPGVLDALAAADWPLVLLGLRPPEGQRLHDVPLDEHAPWIGPGGRPIDTHVVGGFFGGDRAAVVAFYADYDPMLAAMLAADRLGTEENVLTVLYHRDSARATLLPFSTWHHEDSDVRRPGPDDVPFYRIFEELAHEQVSA
jgi:hypothetical protein